MGSEWRKSTYSGGASNQCVECGTTADSVLVRDTADRAGAMLIVSTDVWSRFTSAVR